MNNAFYHKLVDMYAGDELSEELVAEMDTAASTDPNLRLEMDSLRRTVRVLKSLDDPELSDVCAQRILRKILDDAQVPADMGDMAAARQYRLFR
ncbi:MAG: hypothetical protein JSS65_12650 [Armatimonadetes bacterium]|nr:hypothetical protein [Armatimonadota bacterium]